MNGKIICDSGLNNLRFAIVRQAVVDYDTALKYLRAHPHPVSNNENEHIKMKARKENCEAFFKSVWFGELCGLDGEGLMTAVRKRYYNRPIRWGKEPYD